MSSTVTVKTHRNTAGIGVVARLITVTTCMGLSFVAQMNQDLTKSQTTRDSSSDSYSIMPHTILDFLQPLEAKISMAVTYHITASRQSVDDCRVEHLIRSIEDLQIGEWLIHILNCKLLTMYFQGISFQKALTVTGMTEGYIDRTRGHSLCT